MTAVDWFWTGKNNAEDRNRNGYTWRERSGYFPPSPFDWSAFLYRVGWVLGRLSTASRIGRPKIDDDFDPGRDM